ncbi:MAG: molybdenum cofactor guanylyltransferase [Desulfovibrio sp.]|nr:molybdenum cofactor guanylyltransferase [Desulfovibrio sp.]
MDIVDTAVTGIVLAGGMSSRLGRDKGGIVLGRPGGADLVTRAARLLKTFLPRVIIAGRAHADFEYLHDDVPGMGPAGAVAGALRRTGASCLVLACDLPFMNAATVSLLLQAWRQRPEGTLLTAFANRENGRKESLVAIYSPLSLRYFEHCLLERKLAISRIVPENAQYLIPYGLEESLPFFSINYPADLQAAMRILETHPEPRP